MERCATCEHWYVWPEPIRERAQKGVCLLTEAVRREGEEKADHPDSLAIVKANRSEYGAWLETLRTFGCVQHQPREDPAS
jgi:hypothetical protein